MEMRCKTATTLLMVVGLAASLQACGPTRVDTELLTAVSPKFAAEETVSGPLLSQCLAELPAITREATHPSTATYSESSTYKIANRMNHLVETKPYANQIRSYLFPYEATPYFIKKKLIRICYYGQTTNGLIFIHSITSSEDGDVLKQDIVVTIVSAYEKLRGTPLSFGERALMSMAIR